jgi:serine/threonine-protein kinase SRPK3
MTRRRPFLIIDGTNFRDDQHKHVAIKILTADSSQNTRQLDELKILKRVKEIDPTHPGYCHINHVVDDFRIEGPHGEHLCMVTEVLGTAVGALRHRFQHEMLPITLTKQVAKQLLLGLDYLHRSCGVIHCGMLH